MQTTMKFSTQNKALITAGLFLKQVPENKKDDVKVEFDFSVKEGETGNLELKGNGNIPQKSFPVLKNFSESYALTFIYPDKTFRPMIGKAYKNSSKTMPTGTFRLLG